MATALYHHVADKAALVDDAMLAGATSSMAIVGLVEEEELFREMAHPDDRLLEWLPNARMAFHRTPDRDHKFELVVRSLIEGLHSRLTREAEARQRADYVTGSR